MTPNYSLHIEGPNALDMGLGQNHPREFFWPTSQWPVFSDLLSFSGSSYGPRRPPFRAGPEDGLLAGPRWHRGCLEGWHSQSLLTLTTWQTVFDYEVNSRTKQCDSSFSCQVGRKSV